MDPISRVLGWLWWVALLLLLYRVVRWVVTTATGLLKGDYERREVMLNLNGVWYPVSYWCERSTRPYQEDRFQIAKGRLEADSSCYGVFDGHGGQQASQYCQDHVLRMVVESEAFGTNMPWALQSAFHKADEKFLEISRKQGITDGTTAVVAVIHARTVYVANAGDSRAIIVQRSGKVHPMSFDHKPSREDEEKRIKDLGGKVLFWGRWRVEGILAVSRAIGDLNLKPYVTCDPEIRTKTLDDDDMYLVLASDGLWDVMSNEQVARLVLHARDFRHVARDLCQESIIAGSGDNVTCLVVSLKPDAQRVE